MRTDILPCRDCGTAIAIVKVGGVLTYGHLVNPKQFHHEATPPRVRLARAAAVSTTREEVDVPQRQLAPVGRRFWAKVDRSGGPDACWPWTGTRARGGYGSYWAGPQTVGAHRVALEQHLGRALAPDEWALHHCDNPPCCNPAHLFAGTRLDNARDAKEKGRFYSPLPLTHCKHGHDLSVLGSIHGDGRLRCRECHRQSQAKRRNSNPRPVRARRVDRVVIPPDRPSASRPERLGLRSTPGEQA